MAAKKAAIAAAIERAKAQKAAAAPQNVVDAKPEVQAEIAEIDARREAAKLAVSEQTASEQAGDNTASTQDGK
jgi:electron transport complex protein RnfC